MVLIASCSRLVALRGGATGFMALHPWARVVEVFRIVRKAFAARQRYHGAVQTLILSAAAMKRICDHLIQAFPEEGCGLLVGEDQDGRRRVRHAAGVENGAAGDRARRYDIPAERFLEEERRARAEGLEVVGIFHSHPGHAPEPSRFDRERAWP